MNMMTWPVRALQAFLVAGVLCTAPVMASDVGFRGTLMEWVPCVINNGDLISVDFGNEVMTTRVDVAPLSGGFGTYTRTFNIDVDRCNFGATTTRFRISGAGAPFDTTLLDGGREGLAFKFWSMDDIPVNTWLIPSDNIVNRNIFVTLVRQASVTLSAGPFSQLATLEVEYQ